MDAVAEQDLHGCGDYLGALGRLVRGQRRAVDSR
jgi:hypothetical protein